MALRPTQPLARIVALEGSLNISKHRPQTYIEHAPIVALIGAWWVKTKPFILILLGTLFGLS